MARSDPNSECLAKRIGRLTEAKFHLVMRQQDFEWPYWMVCVRPATYQEDLNGVDAYVETLAEGWIPVQIKSSHEGRAKHLAAYGKKHCIIVLPPRIGLVKAQALIVAEINIYRMRRYGRM